MGKFLDIARRAAEHLEKYEINEFNEKRSTHHGHPCPLFSFNSFISYLHELERRCPEHIEAADWQRAVEDGRRFLIQWGERATELGWFESDVFGLPPVASNPHPSWRRLARTDQLGLVWLTHGRPVTSISAESATIATPRGGSVVFYRPRASHAGAVGSAHADLMEDRAS